MFKLVLHLLILLATTITVTVIRSKHIRAFNAVPWHLRKAFFSILWYVFGCHGTSWYPLINLDLKLPAGKEKTAFTWWHGIPLKSRSHGIPAPGAYMRTHDFLSKENRGGAGGRERGRTKEERRRWRRQGKFWEKLAQGYLPLKCHFSGKGS